MTLSHAIEELPSLSDRALTHLRGVIDAEIEQAQKGGAFEEIEKAIHAAFVEAERRILSKALAQYDINVPLVSFEGKDYRQVVRCEQTYTSAVGPINVHYIEQRAAPPQPLSTGVTCRHR